VSDHADTVREFVETAVLPLGPWQAEVLAALDALVAERDEARAALKDE